MNQLYICHSVYHVYISLLKAYNNNNSIDIILVDTIFNANDLCLKLKECGIFNNVILFKRKKYLRNQYRLYLLNYVNYYINRFFINKNMKFIKKYNDIFIFNDYSEIGIYIMCNHIKYHLLEDGLDVFKQFNVYEHIGRFSGLKKIIFRLFGLPYTFGMTKQCIDIEINDDKNLKTDIKQKIIVVNRNKLEDSIDVSFQKKIFKIFGVNKMYTIEKKVIILTQILKELLVVRNNEQQFDYYRDIVKKYCDNYRIYIKPHPRDNINYGSLEKDYGVICLDKNIPMEVYSRLPGMYFELAITYSSTAVNGRKFADKIIRLDNNIDNM